MICLILKCGTALRRRPWRWRHDNYDVVEDGIAVGRIFRSPDAPKDPPWMRTSNEHKGTLASFWL